MKRLTLFFSMILAIFLLAGSTACTRIGVGEGGIKVSMAGSNRGVQDVPEVTGWVFYNPIATNVIAYPMTTQVAIWTKDIKEGKPHDESISFNSKDGLVFGADINISYHLIPGKIPAFYVKYKANDLETFTHGLLHQITRDQFNFVGSTLTAEELYGVKKEDFVKEVRARLNENFKDYLVVESVGFVTALRAPDSFINAVTGKLTATQNAIRVENEVREVEAQAKKQIAKAEGEAKSNQILAASITPNLMEWRRLNLQQDAIGKWSGDLPTYMGSGPTPFLDVTKR